MADTLGVQDFFEDGELQALLDIIGVNHGAEHGAEPFGSTEKVNVFSNKPRIRAGRDQLSPGIKVSRLFGLVYYIDQV